MLASQAEAEEGADEAKGKRAKKPAGDLLADNRFKALFENKEFAIDEQSEEYKALHPNAGEHRYTILLARPLTRSLPPSPMPLDPCGLMINHCHEIVIGWDFIQWRALTSACRKLHLTM